jgi:hypothetical protein
MSFSPHAFVVGKVTQEAASRGVSKLNAGNPLSGSIHDIEVEKASRRMLFFDFDERSLDFQGVSVDRE